MIIFILFVNLKLIFFSFSDDLSEDLSLGLILDDRDDSLFGGNWSDEEEEPGTPRHLPTLDELEDDYDGNEAEDQFGLSRRVHSR